MILLACEEALHLGESREFPREQRAKAGASAMGAERFPRSSQFRRSLTRCFADNNYCPISRGGRALWELWTQTEVKQPTRGPFLESLGIFSDPKANIQIKI